MGKPSISIKLLFNVADKFWGRKYDVESSMKFVDYLREWRNKSGWTTKKIDEHFDISIQQDIGLEKIIIVVVFQSHRTGGN